ncbi:MAG: isoleucine--tRNA ligase [Bacteroidales bacterium]
MSEKFKEYDGLNLSEVNKEQLKEWEKNNTFHKSIDTREGKEAFVFYEGPPSANGVPGIHHVMSRAIKDIFCRYKTMQGFLVRRKAGWDTHGLPVEIGVEKKLDITKDDIGEKISVKEYNETCRKEVMKYKDVWEDLTRRMGYWIDLYNPYITYDNKYIETIWYLLKNFYEKGYLYKGYTIQPYSPAAGTGLSTHELNMPGCYKNVKDISIVAQFKVMRGENSEFLFKDIDTDLFFLAWTTTPWTLPSNTALGVGPGIQYVKVRTFNQYTYEPITVILAKELLNKYFPEKHANLKLEDYKPGDKEIPYKMISEFSGKQLEGIRYEQLMPYHQPEDGDAFKVVTGDFVTTEEGTGIVHLAPSFGADDFKVSYEYGIGSLTLVDKQGKFVDGMGEFSGRYVKNDYDPNLSEDDPSVDVDIAVKLKKENRAFKIEKYEHAYPHCWRTDKPVLYYPLDSWFIKTTAKKDKLLEHNRTINWKPESTGTGRFGKWLENLVDWNLSRDRYWGTPLPIWSTEDNSERICIGSVYELKNEIDKAVETGFMEENPLKDFMEGDHSRENYDIFDLHRPFVDEIILVSSEGKKMFREPALIDVWFDSGAMPYAQHHYPFENKENFDHLFPADYIAEGVDQTRGWFFTLHTIAVMLFDSVAFKNIISNGLVLDKDGNKMSKRLGNVIDPFDAIEEHGSDPLRWYMITNAQPWDNLKFDMEGLKEVKRKFFGTLFNIYSFFSLYANIDGFQYREQEIPLNERPEIDQWIISLLNSLIKEVEGYYEDYEPTRAGRSIQYFVTENLSNWYVRLNRKRFWGGGYSENKISAYQTLYKCLETISQLMAPIAPFYADKLFKDLNRATGLHKEESVHLSMFPESSDNHINKDLEDKMDIAQRISSMVLSLRRKVNIKVRQPLNKILLPVFSDDFKQKFEAVKNLVLTEVNVKNVEYISDTSELLIKKVKPNFKKLGPKYGRLMKQISTAMNNMEQKDILQLEKEGRYYLNIDGQTLPITPDDVEITSEDIPGWLVFTDGELTVALDITITGELKQEGIAREFVNRIQNLRKDKNFKVTDKIRIHIQSHNQLDEAIEKHKDYIGNQTLAESVNLVDSLNNHADEIEIDKNVKTLIKIEKI